MYDHYDSVPGKHPLQGKYLRGLAESVEINYLYPMWAKGLNNYLK